MQFLFKGDNLHEISKPIFCQKYARYYKNIPSRLNVNEGYDEYRARNDKQGVVLGAIRYLMRSHDRC